MEANFRPLRFAHSTPTAETHPSALTPAQGSVRVRLYSVRKIAFNSDPEEALGQVEVMKREIAAVVGPTHIPPSCCPSAPRSFATSTPVWLPRGRTCARPLRVWTSRGKQRVWRGRW